MTSEPTERGAPAAVGGEQEPPTDWEYDLAHDGSHEAEHRPLAHEPIYVATETAEYDGDYGYDLAHDVPGR